MNRAQNTKLILWIITGFAAAVGLTRFIFGLGVTTNLNDTTPWGLWIGFDVMGGVALAAGGFVITAIFYIMKREEFQPLVKPAVLTAFLGYLAVMFGLIFDLGLPWNIWSILIHWNPHSPLFEVGWCVILYSTVLLLEFSPVPLENFSRYAKIRSFLMKFRFIFVLLGIMLSTLHQSSLGSLFLVMPFKLHPLWYSNILPVQFFISAIALGLMMVAFESQVTHWLYHRKSETNLIAKLGKATVWILLIYFIIKMTDIIISDEFTMIFNGSWESYLFIIEMLISVIIPVIIFTVPRLRQTNHMQWVGSLMVVIGMVFNRINVGGLTMLSTTGDSYIPSWMEIAISLGVVSAAVLVFLFSFEHFHIWEKQPRHPESFAYTPPSFDYASAVWLGSPGIAALSKYSLAFVLSFAVGMALMPGSQVRGEGIEDITVRPANGKDTLHINGNRDDFNVEFPHKEHIKRIGEDKCIECHHLSLPRCDNNSCWECHTSMYKAVDFFKHDWHSLDTGGNIKCVECHTPGQTKNAETAKKCTDCHPKYTFSTLKEGNPKKYYAPSYTDALHKLCVSCHMIESTKLKDKPKLAECATCHESELPQKIEQNLKWEISLQDFNRVILPVIDSVKIKGAQVPADMEK
jgi:Ni/Fe-hydrogenase subunit HybB-like protein